jgi:hypothetical protein
MSNIHAQGGFTNSSGIFWVKNRVKSIAMIEHGVPITLVRDCLWHPDLKTTEIYLS